jgi:hypothetical protein
LPERVLLVDRVRLKPYTSLFAVFDVRVLPEEPKRENPVPLLLVAVFEVSLLLLDELRRAKPERAFPFAVFLLRMFEEEL